MLPSRAMSRLMAMAYDRFMRASERACLDAWRGELLAGLTGDVLEIGAGTGANLPHYPPSVRRLVLTEADRFMRAKLEEQHGLACAKPTTCTEAEAKVQADIKAQYDENERKAEDAAPLWIGAGVAGVLLVGGGIVLLATAPPLKRDPSPSQGIVVHVVPNVGIGQQGLSVVGTF